MTEYSENPPAVRNLFETPPKAPKHKQFFDEFVDEALHSTYILDNLFLSYPELSIYPSNPYGNEQAIRIAIDHGSELAHEVDWLGGNFCQEKISFLVQKDGSLLRIIEITPTTDPSKANSRYINANLGTGMAREFTNYISGDPWKDVEGILPFLELDEDERQEIASLHQVHRREYFVANQAVKQSVTVGDTSD